MEIPHDVASEFSVITPSHLQQLSEQYHLIPDDGAVVPDHGVSVMTPPPGKIAFYTAFFETGLRFPPTAFFGEVITHYKTHIAQLKPNAVSKLVCFELLCHGASVLPSVLLFRRFFHIHRSGGWYTFRSRGKKLFKEFPDSDRRWKTPFIWVNKRRVGFFNQFRAHDKKSDKGPKPTTDLIDMSNQLASHEVLRLNFPEPILALMGISPYWVR